MSELPEERPLEHSEEEKKPPQPTLPQPWVAQMIVGFGAAIVVGIMVAGQLMGVYALRSGGLIFSSIAALFALASVWLSFEVAKLARPKLDTAREVWPLWYRLNKLAITVPGIVAASLNLIASYYEHNQWSLLVYILAIGSIVIHFPTGLERQRWMDDELLRQRFLRIANAAYNEDE